MFAFHGPGDARDLDALGSREVMVVMKVGVVVLVAESEWRWRWRRGSQIQETWLANKRHVALLKAKTMHKGHAWSV